MKTNLIRKKIFFLTLIFFSTFHSFSQIFPPTGSHNYHPELDKFVGTWKWSNATGDELTLKIKKILYHYDMHGGFFEEKLVACHKYIKNGIII